MRYRNIRTLFAATMFAALSTTAVFAGPGGPGNNGKGHGKGHDKDRPAHVQQNGKWKKMGTQGASTIPEKDVMKLRGNKSWDRMKLKVTGADLNMYNVKLVYEDGTKQQIPLKMRMKAGEESRVFVVNGKKRVQEIQFIYETKGVDGRAKIEVWAIDR